ncbi:hypothetical protein NDU88_008759 [Pleurodeles waltl]|uniref:Uncharacterized protein n=1 Tax=Pleurodeles waltl TaxID=8319 RepID=A0AAV7QRL7_PLEWA|nr:hypothetical protein NDU88_008759 [Pleurodeles waltl]
MVMRSSLNWTVACFSRISLVIAVSVQSSCWSGAWLEALSSAYLIIILQDIVFAFAAGNWNSYGADKALKSKP